MKSMRRLYIASAICALMLCGCESSEFEGASNIGEPTAMRITCFVPQSLPTLSDTRGYSDGKTAKELKYALYDVDSDGNHTLIRTNEEGYDVSVASPLTFSDGDRPSVSFDLTFTLGRSYTMTFFAESEESPYAFDPETATVTVDYDRYSCNDERGDCFYKTVSFVALEGEIPDVITLTRPVAQLNVGTGESDWQKAVEQGVAPTQTALTVTDAYSTINLLDGSVSDPVTATLAMAEMPAGETFPKYNEDGVTSPYHYLAMGYFLVADEAAHDVTFAINGTASFGRELIAPAVPLARNHRTNLFGDLLALADAEKEPVVIVEIDPIFEGEYNLEGDGPEGYTGVTYNYQVGWWCADDRACKSGGLSEFAAWVYGGRFGANYGLSSLSFGQWIAMTSYDGCDFRLTQDIEIKGGEKAYTYYNYEYSSSVYNVQSSTDYYWFNGDMSAEINDNVLRYASRDTTFDDVLNIQESYYSSDAWYTSHKAYQSRILYLNGHSITLNNASLLLEDGNLTIVGPGLIECKSTDGVVRSAFTLTSSDEDSKSSRLEIRGGEYRAVGDNTTLFALKKGYAYLYDGYFLASKLTSNSPIIPEKFGIYSSGGVYSTSDVFVMPGTKQESIDASTFQSLYDSYIAGASYSSNKYVADGTESFYQVVEK